MMSLTDLSSPFLILSKRSLRGDGAGVVGGCREFQAAFLCKLSCKLLVRDDVDDIAGFGHFVPTRDGHGGGGTCLFDLSALVVHHSPDLAGGSACNDVVAYAQRARLHEYGRHFAYAFVEAGFDDGAACGTVGIGFELSYLRHDEDVFKRLSTPSPVFAETRTTGVLAAPFFGQQIVVGELLQHLIGIGALLVYLVDSDDDGHFRLFCVVDRLDGLRHYAVVGGDHQHGDVGDLRAARSHGRERLVAGSVQEGDGEPFKETVYAPMCCVMPPASPPATFALRM